MGFNRVILDLARFAGEVSISISEGSDESDEEEALLNVRGLFGCIKGRKFE